MRSAGQLAVHIKRYTNGGDLQPLSLPLSVELAILLQRAHGEPTKHGDWH
jgi:hypothetical protein